MQLDLALDVATAAASTDGTPTSWQLIGLRHVVAVITYVMYAALREERFIKIIYSCMYVSIGNQ